jgi:hypothetical protein
MMCLEHCLLRQDNCTEDLAILPLPGTPRGGYLYSTALAQSLILANGQDHRFNIIVSFIKEV